MPAPKPANKCPVLDYAERVTSGKIVAGRLVRLACQRHIDDVKDGIKRGLRWDAAAAKRAIDFCELLHHSKGEWAGQHLVLSLWQKFIVGSLFGWKRADGSRRFRTAYDELARKNGKSTLAAAIGLYLAFFCGEPGAEVYTAATKLEQAKIVHNEADRMVKASPGLKRRIQSVKGNLSDPSSNSKYQALGGDADTLDGLNPSAAIIDELHKHKSRDLLDVLETGMGARREPLVFIITTAGLGKDSVCGVFHDYAVDVLEGQVKDDSFFAFVAGLDVDDDWREEKNWPKANPNLGVSVKLDDLREKCERAKKMPSAENTFRRLRLNQWVEQAVRWINMALWQACALPPRRPLEGRSCFAGLDLSSTLDVAALVLAFAENDWPEPLRVDLLSFFWIPEEACRERERLNRQRFDLWVRSGLVEATPGAVVDYDRIRAKLGLLQTLYNIRKVALDRWNATQLGTQLMADGFEVVFFGQGFASMSGPAKEFERLLVGGMLAHAGNDPLTWMARNAAVEQDAAGNIKPSKKRSTEKIDGIVAAVQAIGVGMVEPVSAPTLTVI